MTAFPQFGFPDKIHLKGWTVMDSDWNTYKGIILLCVEYTSFHFDRFRNWRGRLARNWRGRLARYFDGLGQVFLYLEVTRDALLDDDAGSGPNSAEHMERHAKTPIWRTKHTQKYIRVNIKMHTGGD